MTNHGEGGHVVRVVVAFQAFSCSPRQLWVGCLFIEMNGVVDFSIYLAPKVQLL